MFRRFAGGLDVFEVVLLTLTYADEKLPSNFQLRPKDLTDFWKRLRHTLPVPVRYFACGEYGETSGRPHYHAILFGAPFCEFFPDVKIGCTCVTCLLYASQWQNGAIHAGAYAMEAALYVARYVLKKRTATTSVSRIKEFTKQSRSPPLATMALKRLSTLLLSSSFPRDDVPASLIISGKPWPLSQAQRRRLRIMMGLDPAKPLNLVVTDAIRRSAQSRVLLDLQEGQVGSFSFEKSEREGLKALASEMIRDALKRSKL